MSTTNEPTTGAGRAPSAGRARGRHARSWPSLTAGVLGKGILVAGVALAVAAAGLARASASTHNWIATGWNIHLLYQAQPATTSHFFNTSGAYGTGADPASSPVSDGFGTTPVLAYWSYAQFASDINHGAITSPYHWVLYDPEYWPQTPLNEQQDPRTYLRMFGQLAHAHGYQVIETPARDLGNTSGSVCPKQIPETLNQWYLRCNIAGAAGAYSDVFVLQDQVNTTSLTEYQWLFNSAKQQARAANPHVVVDAEISTNYGTANQMAAAARSVAADGFYVSMTATTISLASQFFQKMQAAGY
jgi:hypothetical protein